MECQTELTYTVSCVFFASSSHFSPPMEHPSENGESEKLLLEKTYKGYVNYVDNEHVVVIYETGEDAFEHTYSPSQFIDGIVPKVDDDLLVTVQVKRIMREVAEFQAINNDEHVKIG